MYLWWWKWSIDFKTKKIFKKLADEITKEITELDEKVDPNNLIYRYKSNTADTKFNEFDNDFSILDKIRNGKISLANPKMIKRNLNEI